MDRIKTGKDIERRRLAMGLTHQGLAEKLGVTPARLAEWESGIIDMYQADYLIPLINVALLHVEHLHKSAVQDGGITS